jgi:hypothetical protein
MIAKIIAKLSCTGFIIAVRSGCLRHALRIKNLCSSKNTPKREVVILVTYAINQMAVCFSVLTSILEKDKILCLIFSSNYRTLKKIIVIVSST